MNSKSTPMKKAVSKLEKAWYGGLQFYRTEVANQVPKHLADSIFVAALNRAKSEKETIREDKLPDLFNKVVRELAVEVEARCAKRYQCEIDQIYVQNLQRFYQHTFDDLFMDYDLRKSEIEQVLGNSETRSAYFRNLWVEDIDLQLTRKDILDNLNTVLQDPSYPHKKEPVTELSKVSESILKEMEEHLTTFRAGEDWQKLLNLHARIATNVDEVNARQSEIKAESEAK